MTDTTDSVLWLEAKAAQQVEAGEALLRGGAQREPDCIEIGRRLSAIADELSALRALADDLIAWNNDPTCGVVTARMIAFRAKALRTGRE